MRRKIERRKSPYVFTPAVQICEKFEQVQDKLGLPYASQTFDYIIIMAHKELFKDYLEVMKSKKAREVVSPEEQARRYEEVQAAKRQEKQNIIDENGIAICNELDGVVIGEGQFKSCEYTTYEKVSDNYVITGKMTVPFESLKVFHATTQYKGGSKSEVLEALKRSNEQS